VQSTTCIFDVGKTNKKVFLFDEHLNIVHERCVQLPETIDGDGFPCEDLNLLTKWIKDTWEELRALPGYKIDAVNFSGYGASFVLIDEEGVAMPPLSNYLKPYPDCLLDDFHAKYGSRENISLQTCSPALGNLNSGLQLYRIKHTDPELWKRTKYALHLPQYLSSIFSGKYHSELTSIGCHTALWDFAQNDYHDWVYEEEIHKKLPPIVKADHIIKVNNVIIGPGLHDSSAALIPYLNNIHDPFLLISTGTWSISLNPFNHTPLTVEELRNDCLCYFTFDGKPVKASRLFAGNEHELHVKQLASRFNVSDDFYNEIEYDPQYIEKAGSIESAYHEFIAKLISDQVKSSNLVMKGAPVQKIYVDGGFAKNRVFLQMLGMAYPSVEIYAATVCQASALGAAIVIHTRYY
jgi:L-fuculokinase